MVYSLLQRWPYYPLTKIQEAGHLNAEIPTQSVRAAEVNPCRSFCTVFQRLKAFFGILIV